MGELGERVRKIDNLIRTDTYRMERLVHSVSDYAITGLRNVPNAMNEAALVVASKVARDVIDIAKLVDTTTTFARIILNPGGLAQTTDGLYISVKGSVDNKHWAENKATEFFSQFKGLNLSSKGTVSKEVSEINTVKAEDVIAERVKDFDLREHPVPYKQLSAKKMNALKLKIENRTITKEEYHFYIWNKKFAKRRDKGVVQFWKQERIRILNGDTPTRNWTSEQIEDILNKKRPKFNGQTLQGHHTYSAAKYPHLADKGEVIYPLTYKEHFYGWHGGNYKDSLPGKPIKEIIDF